MLAVVFPTGRRVMAPPFTPRRLLAALAGMVGVLAATIGPARADAAAERWVQSFWPRAQEAGISWQTYSAALGNFQPDATVIPQATNQPEFVRPIWDYLDTMVSPQRIANGLAKIPDWGQLLGELEAHYGVNRYVILAIWGLETSYGQIMGSRSVIRSLATLAYMGGSRQRFGETQLLAALRIVQRGDVTLSNMVGSWAGAMGHTQFIPTTFEAYAVDWDGDGRRDVWSSPVDALASAAAYLARMGWQTGKTWGYEVRLPRTFDYARAESSTKRPISEWHSMGIRRASGADFPRPSDDATLWIPAGANGPAFLLLDNFRVIKRYNNADSYALAVGHLADRLQGFGPFVQQWPREERPLNEQQRRELQRLLAGLGLYAGPIDAIVGTGTRTAIRNFQRAHGLVPDGHPSDALLQRLRAAR
jgi:membrane-bound lytic murein transglycosylase B